MSLESGSKFGPYEILEPVLVKNNGHTFKASDTRSNRKVVIRLLPPEFSESTQIKERLQLEAKALTALNHPHICAVYEVAEQDGADYVVMEYLEGETLSQRLKRGPLELDEALKIAVAIADALDKAHRRGVTHRSLNPGNVLLTASGAKLMGFGSTNPMGTARPAVTNSSLTRSSGGLLATMDPSAGPYLAPEVWEGSDADARADIFAFGTVLYEMLTGTPAFEGKTQALLIAAIQTVDPDPVSQKQPMAPPALDYLVKRCLEKDPKQRLQTAWDLLSQLQWIAEGGSQIGIPAQVTARHKKQNRVVWIALAAALLLVLAMAPATYHYLQGSPEPEEIRFIVSNMGSSGTGGAPASISPDGRWIVRSPGGSNGLNAVLLSSVTQQFLMRDNIVTQPFWSPDSRSIGFFEDGKLKSGEVSGGPSKNICEAAAPIAGGTWSSDGVILFSGGGLIYRVLAAGGQPTAVTALDVSKKETEHLSPFFLPDGRHYLYLALSATPSDSAIYVGTLDSKDRTRLIASESRAFYAAPGYLLFNRESAIFAQPFDPSKLTVTGEPVRIVDGVPFITQGPNTSTGLVKSASFGVSQTGVLAHRVGASTNAQSTATNTGDRVLTWIDRSGARIGQVGGPANYAGIDLSPDAKKVAVHVEEALGGDSWFFDSVQGRMQRLTFGAAQNNSMPIWSPDGMRIAFSSKRNGKWGLYVKLADGTAKEELITESELPKVPMSWTPDGTRLVYEQIDPKTSEDVWVVPVTGDKKPISILQSEFRERNPQVSPDGKWIAYGSTESGRAEIYIKPFPEGPGNWQISTDGGRWPRWRGDSKELFFVLPPSVLAVDINVAGSSIQAGAPHVLFGINNPGPGIPNDYNPYAVAADGKRFLVPQTGAGAAASGGLADQLATAADQSGPAGLASNAIMVVLNWTHLLKRK